MNTSTAFSFLCAVLVGTFVVSPAIARMAERNIISTPSPAVDENLRWIEEFNKEKAPTLGFTVASNHFIHFSSVNFNSMHHNGFLDEEPKESFVSPFHHPWHTLVNFPSHLFSSSTAHNENESRFYDNLLSKLPTELDWRSKGVITPIKNQGSCGSCWSFATTGALEAANAIAGNPLTELSEQQLVDCDLRQRGCKGGTMSLAYAFIRKKGGLQAERRYPYEGTRSICRTELVGKSSIVTSLQNYTILPRGSEKALQLAVATYGPVSVAIDSSPKAFQFYSSGIYQDPQHECSRVGLNHAVLVVGYGREEATGTAYWIIKNSWGKGWGMDGYAKMLRGVNICGIANLASFPLV
ncbi:Cathepsin K [Balamuthia mandrillaris]